MKSEMEINNQNSCSKIENICLKCDKKFVDAYRLKKHLIQNSHFEFGCSYCVKIFKKKNHLRRHIYNVHSNQ